MTQPGSEGVGRYVATLSQNIASNGFHVVVIGPPESPMHRMLEGGDVDFIAWSSSRHPTEGLVSDIRFLRQALDVIRPDVVHLHSSKAGTIGRLSILGSVPTVFQPHAWAFEAVSGPMVQVVSSWERFASRWTDVLVLVSEQERDSGLARRIGASVVETVPNPVDAAFFSPRDVNATGPIGTLAAGTGPVALCVGRLCHQKGQDELLAAWPLVRSFVPDAKLLFAGDGPLHSRLQRLADDSVTLLGNRSDMADLYREVDLAVLPSRYEGMSLAMLEAMASGLSVVATDVGGVSETIGRGAGAIVPIGDRRRLAAAIAARLLDDRLREREGQVGRQIVLDDHGVDRAAESLCRLYRSMITAQPASIPSSRVVSV